MNNMWGKKNEVTTTLIKDLKDRTKEIDDISKRLCNLYAKAKAVE